MVSSLTFVTDLQHTSNCLLDSNQVGIRIGNGILVDIHRVVMSVTSQKPIKNFQFFASSSCQGGLASSSTTEVASSGVGSIALLLSKTIGGGLRAPPSLPPQEVGPKLLPLPPQVLDPEQQPRQPQKVALSPCQTQEKASLPPQEVLGPLLLPELFLLGMGVLLWFVTGCI
ncbi:hypothetical protein FH972_019559 [Carpinus fangiana]|uniref:Uncharacterized protein n=1 Tax=Carpinus fangiana TaxID=176857 RepID=A0A5N6RQT6_9ROSI|nr:hypothetical protein FH972_019559 [Carpinus fangiana]